MFVGVGDRVREIAAGGDEQQERDRESESPRDRGISHACHHSREAIVHAGPIGKRRSPRD